MDLIACPLCYSSLIDAVSEAPSIVITLRPSSPVLAIWPIDLYPYLISSLLGLLDELIQLYKTPYSSMIYSYRSSGYVYNSTGLFVCYRALRGLSGLVAGLYSIPLSRVAGALISIAFIVGGRCD